MAGEIGFADPRLNEEFRREGFAVAPLLDESDIEKLRAFYSQLQGAKVANFTIDAMDPDYRYRMNRGLYDVLAPKIAKYLPRSRVFGCNYVVKEPGNPTLSLHQDNAICDETYHTAVLCWCPLVETTEENGCLTIVPRSHRWTTQRRAFGDQLDVSPFRNVVDLIIERFQILVPVQPGTAIFYDPRTIHGSVPNRSTGPRIATLSGTLVEGAPIRFHHRHSPTEVEAFDADESFFWKEMFVFTRPKQTPSLGMIDMLDEGPFDEAEFLRRVEAAKVD